VNDPRHLFPDLPEDTCIIDTHCHLDMNDYAGDLDAVIERARQKKVEKIITIGISLESSKKGGGPGEKISRCQGSSRDPSPRPAYLC